MSDDGASDVSLTKAEWGWVLLALRAQLRKDTRNLAALETKFGYLDPNSGAVLRAKQGASAMAKMSKMSKGAQKHGSAP